MKKMLQTLVLVGLLAPLSSHAGPRVGWQCTVDADLSGYDAGMGAGWGKLSGEGELRCTSFKGEKHVQKVRVKMRSFGVGIGYSEISDVTFYALGLGLDKPQAMLNKYRVGVGAGATLVKRGFDVDVAFSASSRGKHNLSGVSIEGGLATKRAKGAEVHARFSWLKISAADETEETDTTDEE